MSDDPSRNRGVIITGGVGVGKTAILEQLIEHSPFKSGNTTLVTSGESRDFVSLVCQ